MKEKKKLFKNKYYMIIYTGVFIILIILFIVVGKTNFKHQVPDNKKFHLEFPKVDKHNVFKYVNVVDAHLIASGHKGIVLFGNTNNPWLEYYAKILNEVARNLGIKEIYYYDITKDRNNKNATYEDMVKILGANILVDDEGKTNIYSPSLLVMGKNKLILFDDRFTFHKAKVTPASFFSNEYNYSALVDMFTLAFLEYKKE